MAWLKMLWIHLHEWLMKINKLASNFVAVTSKLNKIHLLAWCFAHLQMEKRKEYENAM